MPMGANHLLRIMLHLCKGKAYDKQKLIDELSGFASIQPRTIASWFSKETKLRSNSREEIVRYFAERHKIRFNYGWFDSTFDQFVESLSAGDHAMADGQRVPADDFSSSTDILVVKLADKIGYMSDEDVKSVCGKYKIYRYSFSDAGDVVTELAVISKAPTLAANFLRIKMYGNTASLAKKSARTKPEVELFEGIIFKFGRMYSAITSYRGKNRDRRMRYLFFPALDHEAEIHYGLMASYSVHLHEPVAARVIAYKMSEEEVLAENDKREVKRGKPNKANDPDSPTVPPDLLHLITNHIDGKNASILMVDQKMIPRRFRES